MSIAQKRRHHKRAPDLADQMAALPIDKRAGAIAPLPIECEQAEIFEGLYLPNTFKVFYGGRGTGKSWAIARFLIGIARSEKTRIGCFREFQSSISDSVHRLLTDQIYAMGCQADFHITEKNIICLLTGTEFIFKGLRRSINEIKSTEGIKYTWVEEAQGVSEESWQILLPTIMRVAGGELIISFNPDAETDPTFKRFVKTPPLGAFVQKVNYYDNPWFPPELDRLRLHDLATDPEAYDWIWEGNPRKVSEAIIFRNRVLFDTFEPPDDVRWHQGLDFGFANDPNAFIRSWIENDELYIYDERFGYQIEIDDLPKLIAGRESCQTKEEENAWTHDDDLKWPGIPGAKNWPIKADNARPETISYMSRKGFNISAADKWPGSIEDGVAHLKGFKVIHIHAVRCPNMAREARLYSYKVDKKTNEVLPVIVDKWNHGWDALRYSLDGYIQSRGGMGVWKKFGEG